jgi:hypothetical protein
MYELLRIETVRKLFGALGAKRRQLAEEGASCVPAVTLSEQLTDSQADIYRACVDLT